MSPIVDISLLEGQDPAGLDQLAKTVTEAVVASLEVRPEQVRVLVRELPLGRWYVAGGPLGLPAGDDVGSAA